MSEFKCSICNCVLKKRRDMFKTKLTPEGSCEKCYRKLKFKLYYRENKVRHKETCDLAREGYCYRYHCPLCDVSNYQRSAMTRHVGSKKHTSALEKADSIHDDKYCFIPYYFFPGENPIQ